MKRVGSRYLLAGFMLVVLFFFFEGVVVHAKEDEVPGDGQQEEMYDAQIQEYLMEQMEMYEMDEIQKELDALLPAFSLDLEESLSLILQGKVLQAMGSFGGSLKEALSTEVSGMKQIFVSILVIGIVSSLFSNFSDIFSGKQVSYVGFYFMYLFLMAVLTKAFSMAAETAVAAMENAVLFVKFFVPAFFMAVGASVGSATAIFYYEIMLVVAYLVESFLLHGLIPLIYSYVMLALLNGIWAEERLTLLLDLLKKGILFAQKAVMGIITGLSLVQAVIVPAIDGLKISAFRKAVSAIPGIGNAAEGVAELVLGSAVLIKNGLGILFLLLILLVCALPLLKIFVTATLMKAGAALAGIISDKRISGCADRVGEGCFLLLGCLFTAIAMFLIIIGVVAYAVR